MTIDRETMEELIDYALDCLEKSEDHFFFSGKDKIFFPGQNMAAVDLLGSVWPLRGQTMVHNYWDSDPFDYRDMNVRDKNDNPADYGNVYREMKRLGLEVGIVTAGWVKSDKVAQRAAEKAKEMGAHPEVSVHFYSRLAQKDREKYKKSLKNVIETFYPNLKLRHFGIDEFFLIRDIFKELGVKARVYRYNESGKTVTLYDNVEVDETSVSDFSGRAKKNVRRSEKNEHVGELAGHKSRIAKGDTMSCMRGFHIQPDGDILFKESDEQGVRPEQTGYNIY